jgi:hypothetical protein
LEGPKPISQTPNKRQDPMTAKLFAALLLVSTLAAQEALIQDKNPTTQSKPSSRPANKKTVSKIIKQPVWKNAPGMGRFQFSGAPFANKKISSVSAGQLLKKFKELQGKTIRLYGKVEQTCAKKGCWMWVTDIKDPKQKIWVRFKDYGFFVPKKGAEGRLVVMEGIAKEVTFSVKTARHIKEDAGDFEGAKKITKPVKMIQLTATSVMIMEGKKGAKKTTSKPSKNKNHKEGPVDEVGVTIEEETEDVVEEEVKKVNEPPLRKIKKAQKVK